MATYSTATRQRPRAQPQRRAKKSHAVPIAITAVIGAVAIGVVAFLLWPTWDTHKASDPSHLPMSIGDTAFNVPTNAVRVKLQKRTGPQERVDLNFLYPSLEPPAAKRAISAENADDPLPAIDRLFLSIAAHRNALAPDERMRTIYPRYLDQGAPTVTNGLSMRAFRDNTPYANEDLFYSSSPAIVARCSRDASTPGMCLSERRIDGADLTFRFPRSWLGQWREVAGAMDQVVARMRKPRS